MPSPFAPQMVIWRTVVRQITIKKFLYAKRIFNVMPEPFP
jgi:hypothetical protein